MSNTYSATSVARLQTCHKDLQKVFYEVLNGFDHTIICGHRGEAEQEAAFMGGKSKVRWPNSKHNKSPSHAVDAMPYPIDWMDMDRVYYFAGYVMATAKSMGVELRWGGNWKRDNDFEGNSFFDGAHFELV